MTDDDLWELTRTRLFWAGILANGVTTEDGAAAVELPEDEGEDDKPDSTPADTSLPPSEQTTAEHSDDGEMPK